VKGRRDLASLAILVACGLRRHEAVELNVLDLQQREDHWAIVDLIGKASHIRTIPVPDWVKNLIDVWLHSAGISNGRIFRRVTRAGTVWGSGLSEKVVWQVVRQYARKAGIVGCNRGLATLQPKRARPSASFLFPLCSINALDGQPQCKR
jgi:site-specific recombinase XerD